MWCGIQGGVAWVVSVLAGRVGGCGWVIVGWGVPGSGGLVGALGLGGVACVG